MLILIVKNIFTFFSSGRIKLAKTKFFLLQFSLNLKACKESLSEKTRKFKENFFFSKFSKKKLSLLFVDHFNTKCCLLNCSSLRVNIKRSNDRARTSKSLHLNFEVFLALLIIFFFSGRTLPISLLVMSNETCLPQRERQPD